MSTMSITRRKVALAAVKRYKARDTAYRAERDAQYQLPIRKRSFDWLSYCRHGSYVGDAYGADYLCPRCEDGATVYDEALWVAAVAERDWDAIMALIPQLQKAERLGAIDSADVALSRAVARWRETYLDEGK